MEEIVWEIRPQMKDDTKDVLKKGGLRMCTGLIWSSAGSSSTVNRSNNMSNERRHRILLGYKCYFSLINVLKSNNVRI